MATVSKLPLSGSTNGRQVKVAATATLGTTVHTAGSGTANWDEVWLYAVNSDTVNRLLTVEWGEATSPDGHVQVTIPAQSGYVLVIPGLLLQNSLVVTAYAAAANVILVSGFVNRISA